MVLTEVKRTSLSKPHHQSTHIRKIYKKLHADQLPIFYPTPVLNNNRSYSARPNVRTSCLLFFTKTPEIPKLYTSCASIDRDERRDNRGDLHGIDPLKSSHRQSRENSDRSIDSARPTSTHCITVSVRSVMTACGRRQRTTAIKCSPDIHQCMHWLASVLRDILPTLLNENGSSGAIKTEKVTDCPALMFRSDEDFMGLSFSTCGQLQ
ncbi:hypothetical protein MJO28_014388 [Puccinia striiformis f. sp. tritici]|uniref:Uncharacterized protein n=1 Tax=Puccinia striiformis f. sp. tritici TaxID=168172 RepID=A0ACC0DTD6_9BASI|nr:hypothetical protein MJO28_014388 [Puccinia striiformis f. sp. tritici]KAI7939518.1 hypothetical protein MJO29_014254 [Puccinia striiformis f. sp. tritici]